MLCPHVSVQQLSWRVWGMKRRHAMLREANACALRELGNERAETQRTAAGTASLSAAPSDAASAVDEEELAKLYSPGLRLRPISTSQRSDSSEEHSLPTPEAPVSPTQDAAIESALSEARVPKFYCVLISMHGLVRGEAMELGKDPDTGGQVWRSLGQRMIS